MVQLLLHQIILHCVAIKQSKFMKIWAEVPPPPPHESFLLFVYIEKW